MSSAVTLLGFSDIVPSSCAVTVVADVDIARKLSEIRTRKANEQERIESQQKEKEKAHEDDTKEEQDSSANIKTIPLVVKASEESALQCFVDAIGQLPAHLIRPEVISKSVGTVTDHDIFKAESFKAYIAEFSDTKPSEKTISKAEQKNVQLMHSDVLHLAIDKIGAVLSENLPMRAEVLTLGVAKVIMPIPLHQKRRNVYYVAGCKAVEGVLKKSGKLLLMRDGEQVHESMGAVTMKRFKEDITEIKKGNEFAIHLDGEPPEYREGDEIHCVKTKMEKQTIYDYKNF